MWAALGTDPVPGDPAAVRAAAQAFGRVEQDVDVLTARLDRVAGFSDGLWAGQAADLFAEQLADLLPDLRRLCRSHGLARDALLGYAAALDTAQELGRRAGNAADEAAADGEQAGRDRERAEADRAAALDRLRSATAAAHRTALQRSMTPDPTLAATLVTEEQRQERQAEAAQTQAGAAGQRRDAAAGAEAQARARLAAARRLADDARDLRADAGRVAARRLDEAGDAGIQNRPALVRAFHETVDVVRRITATEDFRNLLDLLDEVGGALTLAGGLIGLVFPPAGAIVSGIGVGVLGVALAGRLLTVAVGNGGWKEVVGAGVKFGFAAFGVGKAATALKAARAPGASRAVQAAGGRFGGAIALAGKVKRSLAYHDNRTLAGRARTLLNDVPVVARSPVPLASRMPAGLAERLEKPVFLGTTGYEVFSRGKGVVSTVEAGVDIARGEADDAAREAARTVRDGIGAIRKETGP